MLRAIALVRWVVEADGADPEALRGSLDPVLAAASERTRFAEALATDLAAVASMPELRERYLAGDGIAGWLARPARAKAVRKVLEDVAAALAAVARPYPEARPVLDALERDLEEPRDWQAPGRFDPATKLREYERSIEVRVQAALGRTVLALRSYRVAQGDVPGELERLAPRFPDGLPVDARTGGPFGYEFDEGAAARLVPSPAPDLGPKGRYDRPRAWKIPFASHR